MEKEPIRKSIRLRGYDYSLGAAYFITICAKGGSCIFGAVEEGAMHVNAAGQIVGDAWDELPSHYPNVFLDAFIVMPNHVHGVIVMAGQSNVGALLAAPAIGQGERPAPTKLGDVVRTFKSKSAIQINRSMERSGPLWQRNYYEHIIRNEKSLEKIRRYIFDNPAQWMVDRDNPAALSPEPKDAWAL